MGSSKKRRVNALLRSKRNRKRQRQAEIGVSVAEELVEARWLERLLLYPESFGDDILPVQTFRTPHHRDVYSAMLGLHFSGVDVSDVPQLVASLATYGYAQLTATAMLQAITQSGGCSADYPSYLAALQARLTNEAPTADVSPGDAAAVDEIVRLELGGGSPFQAFTTEELFAERKPREWLCTHFLARNEPAVIVGPSKCLKSSLAVDLCAALASGGKFLGHFAAEKSMRVGFVSNSEQRQTRIDLATRWGAARKSALALSNLMWLFSADDPTAPEKLGQLRDWIVKHQLEVVVIDAIRMSSTGKRKQAEALQALTKCCLDSGATPILCVQTRKEMKPGKLDAAVLAGSLDFAQQWLLLNRRQHYSPGSGEHRLWLTAGGYAGQGGEWGVDIQEGKLSDPNGRCWEATVHEAEALQDEAERLAAAATDERMRSRIRLAITDLGPANATKLRVRENCGMNGAKFARAWDRMFAAGEIERVITEKPMDYWRYRLAEPPGAEKKEASESSPATAEKKETPESSPVAEKKCAERSSPKVEANSALETAPTGQPKAAQRLSPTPPPWGTPEIGFENPTGAT